LSLSAYQKKVLKDILVPSEIVVDKNNFYILDEFTIHIFKKNNFEMVNKIGKKGEGPGEFKTPPMSISIYDDKLFIYSTGKVCFFSLEGKYLYEKKIPIRIMNLYPFGEKYVAKRIKFPKTTKDTLKVIMSLYDNNFKFIKNIGINEAKNPMVEVNPIEYLSKIQIIGNNLFYGSGQEGFKIKIFNIMGDKLYEIKFEDRNLKIPDAEKEKILTRIKKTPYWNMVKNKIKFPNYYPEIEDFLIDNNNIFVKTFRKKSTWNEFYVISLKGKIKRKIFLPDKKIYTFFYDNFIFLQLNQNDEYEIVSKKWR